MRASSARAGEAMRARSCYWPLRVSLRVAAAGTSRPRCGRGRRPRPVGLAAGASGPSGLSGSGVAGGRRAAALGVAVGARAAAGFARRGPVWRGPAARVRRLPARRAARGGALPGPPPARGAVGAAALAARRAARRRQAAHKEAWTHPHVILLRVATTSRQGHRHGVSMTSPLLTRCVRWSLAATRGVRGRFRRRSEPAC